MKKFTVEEFKQYIHGWLPAGTKPEDSANELLSALWNGYHHLECPKNGIVGMNDSKKKSKEIHKEQCQEAKETK